MACPGLYDLKLGRSWSQKGDGPARSRAAKYFILLQALLIGYVSQRRDAVDKDQKDKVMVSVKKTEPTFND